MRCNIQVEKCYWNDHLSARTKLALVYLPIVIGVLILICSQEIKWLITDAISGLQIATQLGPNMASFVDTSQPICMSTQLAYVTCILAKTSLLYGYIRDNCLGGQPEKLHTRSYAVTDHRGT